MARAQYLSHRSPADLQHPRDLVPAHALAGQLQDHGALILTQHPPLLAWPAESWSPAGSALAPPCGWCRAAAGTALDPVPRSCRADGGALVAGWPASHPDPAPPRQSMATAARS